MKRYIGIPEKISYENVEENYHKLSSNAYKRLLMKNTNYKTLGELLDRNLTRLDLGYEVGSSAYVKFSKYLFIKSRSLQEHSFLFNFGESASEYIEPQAFVNMNLVENDIIISKDSNIGEVIMLDKDYPNTMLSGALYRLPITQYKYYILAMIKHDIFRQQLDFIVPKGATIRHAKTLFLDCKIPFPNHNAEQSIKFIEILTKSIIKKEALIKTKHEAILRLIENELLTHQLPYSFSYSYPTLEELKISGRLDTGIYSEEFKSIEFLIKNYKNGYKSFDELGFNASRGQNLQEVCIGKSIYSQIYQKNFYSLALPTHFSQYGTVDKLIYLGSGNHLKTLKRGEIIFGAEGTFRSIVIIDEIEKFITNIHGITLYKDNLQESIFIKLFMDFLTHKKFIDCIKVGGHGGSVAQKYWNLIPFPNFPQNIQEKIAMLYHNPHLNLDYKGFNLENFTELDNEFCNKAGIYDLDKSIKHLKEILNSSIDKIIDDEKVHIAF